jgi:dTDP-4-amino-4,6-dideoxygalactose transaminase
MKIPLVDLKRQYETIKDEIDNAIKNAILRSDFIFGKDLELFEKEFADYCGTKYAIGVDSGTGALELSLLALGIGPGDEVILPTFTFYSTASSVCYTGAKPVFVDVEETTGNIDINKLKEFISNYKNKSKIKVIIPVHIFGQTVNMDEILDIAQKYNLKVIEDACQSHGAIYKFESQNSKFKIAKAGSMGNIGCFSFYPAKNLGAYGDGGIIVTNDPEIDKKVRLLRDYGRTGKYIHSSIGYNKRLDTLQAAILRVKLKKLDYWNQLRRNNAKIYTELLKDSEIKPLEIKTYSEPIYHMFVVKVKDRDKLFEYLNNEGIGTGIHYPIPLHLQPAFKFLKYSKGDLPVSEKLSEEVISLPMYPELSRDEIEIVVNKILKFYGIK